MKQWNFKKEHEKAEALRIKELAKLRKRKKQILETFIDKEVILHLEKPLIVQEGTFTTIKVTICGLGEIACLFTPYFHIERQAYTPLVVNSLLYVEIIGIEAVVD